MFGDGELFILYRTNFNMMHHFKYDIDMFENMIPFEREIYTHMLIEQLEKDRQRIEKQ